jgi:hypothetical protein
LKKLLPAKFIAISNENEIKFLCEHFKWCLTVHFWGGDITEDYARRGWNLARDVEGNRVDSDDSDNSVWKKPLGGEVLRSRLWTNKCCLLLRGFNGAIMTIAGK